MQNDAIDNLLISISRFVAVDSAGVAITEIDLREGGILIGGGNIGKTSLLNAIRLFLLPEENFKNSKKKFGFADKEGKFYSDDESFEHYFPSNSSFLILECDNYLGGLYLTVRSSIEVVLKSLIIDGCLLLYVMAKFVICFGMIIVAMMVLVGASMV